MDANRACNVLDHLLAHVLETKGKLVAHLIMHDSRNHDAAGVRERLQTRRHVDTVAENIVVVADDIANIDSNAELYAAFGYHLGIALDHAALNFDGATHGVYDADKFNQHPVASGLDDMAAVFGDLGIDQFPAVCFQLLKSSLFVNTHQPTVASNVGRQNGGKPPLDARLDHKIFLS